ncbi:hypothetical protein NMY22_g12962 [Coprinellus aureogranulatus]|nr:hypothetical protein NMY22_g12962 [Coprinellus aureogranulatus]
MERPTAVHTICEHIFGEVQGKGIEYLSQRLNVEQAYREHGAPICVIAPELSSLTADTIKSLPDVDKISLSILLDSLSARALQQEQHSGLTWEELQSLLVQAPYLQPFPSRQQLAVSKDMRGKPKIRWFKKTGEPGMEPDPAAVYELLREVAQRKHEPEAESVDLSPLRRLLTRSRTESGNPRKPTRVNSVDSMISFTHTMMGSICWGTRDAQHASDGPDQGPQITRVPSPTLHLYSEPARNGGAKKPGRTPGESPILLNTSSTQKHSMEPKSSSNWPVMEIIMLTFPTSKEPEFKVSAPATPQFAIHIPEILPDLAPCRQCMDGSGTPSDYTESSNCDKDR